MNQDERRAWDAIERGEVRQALARTWRPSIVDVLMEWLYAGAGKGAK